MLGQNFAGAVFRTNRITGESTVLLSGAVNRPTQGDPVGVAIGKGGAFGTDLYVMDFQGASPDSPLLERIQPSGQVSIFAEGSPWTVDSVPLRMDISPVGEFGEFIFVADPITKVIWRVSPSGQTSIFNTSEVLTPASVRFAPGGAFGNLLYVLEQNGRIVRIKPDGTVMPFSAAIPGVENGGDLVFDATGEHLYVGIKNRVYDVSAGPLIAYAYLVNGFDADNDTLHYRLISGPPNTSIDDKTGQLSWVPDTLGNYDFHVAVADGRGGSSTQEFTVQVKDFPGGEIRGLTYNDANGNGVRDLDSEPGLPDWRIYLDTNANGVRDRSEPVTTTDANGNYSFTNLLPGVWIVGEEQSQNYNAVRDFSIDGNPNVPWSYGYTQTRGSEFQTSTSRIQTPQLELWSATDRGPHIIYNSTGQVIQGGIVYPPDVLTLDPSYDGRNSVLRFTAPVSGEYFVKGRFQGIDLTRGPTTDVAILQNSKTVFAGDIRGFFRDNVSTPLAIVPFNIRISAEAGDTIDFSVGHGPDDSLFDSTGVEVVIDGPPSSLGASVWRQTAPTTRTHSVSLASGEVVRGRDFGNTTLSGINHAPTITSNAITNAIVDNRYLYQVKATDEDGDKLIFDLPVRPEGMAIERNSGIIVWNPKPDQEGTHSVIVRVSDGSGGVKLQSFQISVEPVNHGPIITSKPAGPAVANLPYQYRIRAQDAEGDAIVYTLRSAAIGNMTLNATTGILNWTPTNNDIGTHSIDVTATDADGAGQGQKFDLTVVATAVNRIPILTSKPRDEVRLGTNYLYRIDVSDPDGDPLTIQLTTAPQGMSIDNEGIVTWTPTPTQFGTNPVRIRISDGRGGEIDQSFDVAVLTQGDSNSPVFTSTPRIAATQGVEYRYDVVVQGFEDDMISFALVRSPQGMSIDSLTGAIRWIPAESQIGTADVMVQAMDTRGAATTQAYVIAVRGSNLPPAISSTPNTTSVVDRLYTYAVRATDPEGGPLNFSLISKSGDMRIDSLGIVRWNPTPSETGVVPIAIRVTDDQGVSSEQSYSVTVANAAVNLPPVIHSKPGLNATLNQPYEYRVMATDPEGGQLRFALLEFPDGVTLDESTGIVRWMPSLEGIGVITVLIGDFDGGEAEQSFEVAVRDVNAPPTITSTPVTALDSGNTYRYDVRATDPNNDSMTYALLSGPEGMTIDELGRIRWTTKTTDTGTKRIKVSVVDDRGASVFQEFDLVLTADTEAPKVRIQVSSNPVALGETLDLLVTSSDNTRVVSLNVSVDGKPISLDDRGRASLVMAKAGALPIFAEARDGAGNLGQKSIEVIVIDTSVTGSPTVDVTVPTENAIVSALTDIFGTVQDDHLTSWKLELLSSTHQHVSIIASGTTQITNAKLGTFDPTRFQNDSYILRLTAINRGGLSNSIDTNINVAGNLKLGNFSMSFTDMSIPVAGIPILVTRTYDSLRAQQESDLGFGWSLSFRDVDLRTNLAKTGDEDGGLYAPFRDGTRVFVTLPGGKREGYTFRPKAVSLFDPFQRERDVPPEYQPGSGLNAVYFVPSFLPDKGVTNMLTVPRSQLTKKGREYFQFGGGFAYNPYDLSFGGRFSLTTKEGIHYVIDATAAQVRSISDSSGNSLKFEANRITSTRGVSIEIRRDLENRIVAIDDPAGNSVKYAYDVNGDLVGVTDRTGNKTTFLYKNEPSHFLDRVIDPMGNTGVRTNLDSDGRIISITDALGNTTKKNYTLGNSTEEVVDALGRTTLYQYDSQGNILREVDALGRITQRTFDSENRLTSLTDALGNTTNYRYDQNGNQTSVRNPLGSETYFTYDAQGNRLSTTDALGNNSTNTYDSNGYIIAQSEGGVVREFALDATGRLMSMNINGSGNTTFTSDARGNVTRRVDASGYATDLTYDSNGRPITESTSVTTSSGIQTLVSERTYDAEGRILTITDPMKGVTRNQYDASGRLIGTIDPLGRRTNYFYDERGLLIRTQFPDGTSTSSRYDAEGQLIASIDESNRSTKFVYDKAGQLTETLLPDETIENDTDNPRLRTEYDDVGNVIATIDPAGNRTAYTFDAAGRQTEIRDPLGHTTRSEYDAVGRQIAITNPMGFTTQFRFDEFGRPIKTEFPDGTSTSVTYDLNGRISAQTNQIGATKRFEYNSKDKLVGVVDELGNRTQTHYDELGRVTKRIDANGHVTSFEYDGNSRQISVRRPLGQTSTTIYDLAGQPIRTVNFDGTSVDVDFDLRGRVISQRLSDGPVFQYAYTPTGLLATTTDALGTSQRTYDSQNRLVEKRDSDGKAIVYTYDNASRITEIRTASNIIRSSYDAAGQLVRVSDSNSRITTYTYNQSGHLTSTSYPDGTIESRSHDKLGRLVSMETKLDGSIISGYQYKHDGVGRRTEVVEGSGRTVSYRYDLAGRLVNESIMSAGNPTQSADYSYDSVGNRLVRMDTVRGTTIYVYNINDELLSEKTGNIESVYTYDGRGNLVSKVTGSNDVTLFQWNALAQLIGTSISTAAITSTELFSYDGNGNRVRLIKDGSEALFLVDTNRALPMVLEERTASGTLLASYVYGNGRISQERNGVPSFYHVDALGSTRMLTNINGNVTDRYDYDAFGVILSRSGSTPNTYLFAGETRDASTGLDYLRARYYQSVSGRFLSTDPFSGIDRDPRTLHRFNYAGVDPVNNTDPTGLFFSGSLAEQLTLVKFTAADVIAAYRTAKTLGTLKDQITTFGRLSQFLYVVTVGFLAFDGLQGGTVGHVIYRFESPDFIIAKSEARYSLNQSLDEIYSLNFDLSTSNNLKPKIAFALNKTKSSLNVQLGFNYPLIDVKVGAKPAQFEVAKAEVAYRRVYESGAFSNRLGIEATFMTFGKLALTFYDSEKNGGLIF
jgi:RHS repeat-associated protein